MSVMQENIFRGEKGMGTEITTWEIVLEFGTKRIE